MLLHRYLYIRTTAPVIVKWTIDGIIEIDKYQNKTKRTKAQTLCISHGMRFILKDAVLDIYGRERTRLCCKMTHAKTSYRKIKSQSHGISIVSVNGQTAQQQCCRDTRKMSKRSDNSKYKSSGFENLRNPTISPIFGYRHAPWILYCFPGESYNIYIMRPLRQKFSSIPFNELVSVVAPIRSGNLVARSEYYRESFAKWKSSRWFSLLLTLHYLYCEL